MPIYDIEGCNGCEECFRVCPMDVIRMDAETGLAVIAYPADCQVCNLCVVFCPVDAISLSKDKPGSLLVAWG